MTKRVAILQSNYIPWKGYFDLIASVDEFVLYDDTQFTRRDWRNRNQIKTPQGVQWLTVPVQVKGKYFQTIRETEIDGTTWVKQHLRTLDANYARTNYFKEVMQVIEPLYHGQYHYLYELNHALIRAICIYLGIKTIIRPQWEYDIPATEDSTMRLKYLMDATNGSVYVSGPAAKGYFNEPLFREHNLQVEWFHYDGYPQYPQLWGEYVHKVSILDLLYNCGRSAPQYMRYVKS